MSDEKNLEEEVLTGASVQLPEGVEPNINELFNRNPLDWSDRDLASVVEHMRNSRHIFQRSQEESVKKTGKRNATKAKAALKKPLSQLDLKDLDL